MHEENFSRPCAGGSQEIDVVFVNFYLPQVNNVATATARKIKPIIK